MTALSDTTIITPDGTHASPPPNKTLADLRTQLLNPPAGLQGSDLTGLGGVLLGLLKGANFNVTTDNAVPIGVAASGKYLIDQILVTNASVSLTTAAGGVYTAASKGGTAVVAAGQVYSALTAAAKILALTLAVTDTRTEATLFLNLTTAQGAAATADIYVFGKYLA